MRRLWDKAGFVSYLKGVLQDSDYDAAKPDTAEDILSAAISAGRAEFDRGHMQEAVPHFSLAVSILFDSGEIQTEFAYHIVAMFVISLRESGHLSQAFTASILLNELTEQPDPGKTLIGLENVLRLADIARKAALDAPGMFEDTPQFQEQTLRLLLRAYMEREDFLYALKYGNELLNVVVQIRGENHIEVATIAANLSSACMNLRVFKSAAMFAQRSISVLQNDPSAKPEGLGLAYFNLGRVRLSEGRHADAVDVLRTALEITQSCIGHNDPRTEMIQETLDRAIRTSELESIDNGVVPGQPYKRIMHADGAVAELHDGLPDSDDVKMIIACGEAARDALRRANGEN